MVRNSTSIRIAPQPNVNNTAAADRLLIKSIFLFLLASVTGHWLFIALTVVNTICYFAEKAS
jgi:hypothetical protein